MTNIVFFKKNGYLTGFRASGHANQNVFGKDIVCASISTALNMTAVGILEQLKLKPKFKQEDGFMEMVLNDTDAKNEKAILLMEACLSSLKKIVRENKKYANLEVKDDI